MNSEAKANQCRGDTRVVHPTKLVSRRLDGVLFQPRNSFRGTLRVTSASKEYSSMLPRVSRLKRSRDFQAVYKRRVSWASPSLVLYVRFRTPREPQTSRLGFVISKKIAKRAHDRNRLKRRLREISRLRLLPSAVRPYDALVVARTAAPAADFARLTAEMVCLAGQGGLL